jgi:release factor glutamine methyltransferase
VLDLCAGSGCIAIALAKAFPNADVYAVDISDDAISMIKKNSEHNAVTNVTAIRSDLFADISLANRVLPVVKFDLIVTNPPYIAPEEWSSLDRSVTEWEDKRALVAGHHGLEIIEKIVAQTQQWIMPNPVLRKEKIAQLRIEIGYEQGDAVRKLLVAAGYVNIRIEKDLEGKDRVACADFPDPKI